MNPYEECPEYETGSFILRLVEPSDADCLLVCYSDPVAVARMNTDQCTSNFYYTTREQMKECIDFWLKEYKRKAYVRFSIIPKLTEHAVGTIEIFGGDSGVLRIDIASEYETDPYIEELLYLAVFQFIPDFEIGSLKIKASNTPDRIGLLRKYGFLPSETFRPGMGYYERPQNKNFDRKKGIAFCGLACCVCSENTACAGCRNEGCRDKEWCKSFHCCKSKGLDGCWECADFPCDNPMFDKLRVRTLAEFISEYGEQKLLNALQKNENAGVIYHYKDRLEGDYDLLQSEEEIRQFLLKRL